MVVIFLFGECVNRIVVLTVSRQRFNNRIRAFTPHTSAAEQIEAYADLIGLTEDFLIAVQSYGRIIISEVTFLCIC